MLTEPYDDNPVIQIIAQRLSSVCLLDERDVAASIVFRLRNEGYEITKAVGGGVSARDDYPNMSRLADLAALNPSVAHAGFLEAPQALDEIDRLRETVHELLAQIVAMQAADPAAIHAVIGMHWKV
jgi:hypothetical protein